MIQKRILLLILVVVLTFGGTVSARDNTHPTNIGGSDGSSIEFFGEAARLLQDIDDEDTSYISSITLTLGSDIMVVNGEETPVLSPYMAGGDEILPIADIAEALGAEVDIDDVTGKISIADDGAIVVLDSPSDEEDSQLYRLQEVADVLTLDYAVDGDDIILTRPFQSKMLLVRMRQGTVLSDTYGATDCVADGNGQYVLKYDSIAQTKDAYDAIEALPDCQNIAPNLIVFLFDTPPVGEIMPFALPSPGSWGTKRIQADLMKKYLEDNGKTDTNIIVAIVDSGVVANHPHLVNRLIPGKNFSLSQPDDPNYTNDKPGHGTHVAGTIVDCTPENVKILPIKIFSDTGTTTTSTNISLAIKWAVDNGAKVINISAGSPYNGNDWFFSEPCDYAVSHGVTVVVAAGNSDIDVQYVTPARLASVITVAATDENNQRAFYPTLEPPGASNYGDAIDVSAPGLNIYSSWPISSFFPSGYRNESGTSMAAPHVSAAVAMLSLDNPSLNPEGLRTAVRAISVDLGDPGKDIYYGWGLIDFSLFFVSHEHIWDNSTVTEPTCTAQGFTMDLCSLCGKPQTRDYTNALGHDFTIEIDRVAATCEDGYVINKCSRCPETSRESLPATDPHTWYIGIVTAPAHLTQGYTTYKCTVCEESEVRDYVDALGHTLGSRTDTVLPTCTAKGTWEIRCSVCNSIVDSGEIDALGHLWDNGKITSLPTVVREGVMTYTCMRCQATLTESIPIVKLKNVSVGSQVGTLTAGKEGSVTFRVTTTNIANGIYTATVTGQPTGVTIKGSVSITNNSGTLTLSGNTYTVPGSSKALKLTIDGTTSAAFTLTISIPSTEQSVSTVLATKDEPAAIVEDPETEIVKTVSFARFINGYPNNTFQGANIISREEFINILFKLNNPDVLPKANLSNPSFNDVAPGRWSYDAIEWAKEAGIIKADNNGSFLPATPLTRADMAVMLVKAEGWTESTENLFSDINNHPYRENILIAVKAGVFIGYPDGTFKPDSPAIRAEVVTALVRYMLGDEPTDDMWKNINVQFVDIARSHWAYKYVALATTGFIGLQK